ncbi:MAG: MarR family winged helix-turn-helix transcriptional regulator [Burkholderiales bacterium]
MKRGYHPPLTITRRALLVDGSDIEFRRLIYRLLLVEERLRHVRAFLGRRIGLTGPQYTLLITVAYLQGATGITVQSLARNLRVTSAFITGESRRLIERGLLAKRTNPHDSRSTLLSVTAAGRRRIGALVPELRSINNAFFAHVSAQSFRHARRFLDQLLDGSERVMLHMSKHA